MAIVIKKANKGKLHKALGVAKGKKLTSAQLKTKPGDSPAVRKEKNFARNARTWNKK